MRQIAQYQDGRMELQDVPAPTPPPGGILVRLTHSVISAGTEKMKVEQARMSLVQKARARPDQVRKVLQTATTLGWRAAFDKVRSRLEMPAPLGYSAAGIVEAVDPANTRYRVGDRVAIGGAECAFHAELVAVPDMLAVPIPEGVENWQAAYTTIISIALQAVRQLEPALGDRVLVVGQGLIGLLVTALLRASGARVIAVDVMPQRVEQSLAMGAERVLIPSQHNVDDHVRLWTDGFGADSAVLAAAAATNVVTEQALRVLRDRGRIVVVGKAKVDLPWEYAFTKEIEVRFSRSYGPGRYDAAYEWGGNDYPIGYVRWTERRNFEACLQLIKSGDLDLHTLTTRRLPFSNALGAYEDLVGENAAAEAGIVLEYGETAKSGTPALAPVTARPVRPAEVADNRHAQLAKPVARVDVIGAGNFARSMLLPHLKDRVPLGTVVNNTALSAGHVRKKYGFEAATTDPASVLGDAGRGDQDTAVLIGTRHNLHAPLVTSALSSHRHVFVEKPLCLTRGELSEIEAALRASRGSVQVGFNRRFAPAAVELKKLLKNAPGQKSASFRVMAGPLDPSHWTSNYAESGGRVLGEGCHFLDFLCFLFDAEPLRVSAQPLSSTAGRTTFPDSFAAQVEFADGSAGQVIYTAEGDTSWPKELCTVFAPGLVAEIRDFQSLTVHRKRRRTVSRFSGKGHAEQMSAWVSFLRAEKPHPLSFDAIRRSTLLTFAVVEAIQNGRTIEFER
jgi:predicted dehydrogenase/threonine dehydrogenase-like Zn-dependent dehydrogenase